MTGESVKLTKAMRNFIIAACEALDTADRIIEREFGLDVPKEWNAAYRAVAKSRAAITPAGRLALTGRKDDE